MYTLLKLILNNSKNVLSPIIALRKKGQEFCLLSSGLWKVYFLPFLFLACALLLQQKISPDLKCNSIFLRLHMKLIELKYAQLF